MNTSEKRQNVKLGSCQKCGNPGNAAILIGGYNGIFCDDHLNDWHEVVTDKPDYEDYVVKRISQDTFIRDGVSDQNSRDLGRAILAHQDTFYALAKAWVKEPGEVTETQDGLYHKYNVSKTSGEPVDPKAFYFPLRLDKDPHARSAAKAYADSVFIDNATLSNDLHDFVDGIETELIKKSLARKRK